MSLSTAARDVVTELNMSFGSGGKTPKDLYGTASVSSSGAVVMVDGAPEAVKCHFSVNCLDGDRVVLRVIDHRPVVIANLTNPDISTAEVISHVKDHPNTGVIQNVVVSDSTLQDIDLHGFMASDGTIENTKISGGSIDGATLTNIPYAAIDDLDAHSADIADARIGQATITQAQVENLVADKAEINGKLTAAEGEITNLKAKDATIEGNLTAATGRIDDLESDHVSTTDLQATNARIGAVEADYLKAADMEAETARVDSLLAGKATVNDLNAATGRITQLESADARITGRLDAAEADIDDLEAEDARIGNLVAGKASINDLNAATGRITVLESTKANIADIEANYITADDIEATYMHADMTNSDVAWIQNGVIANGAISSAMINDVSANKLTAGTINGSVINVTNLNADNITAGTINGQRIGEGSLSLDKLSEDVYTEAEVDAKLSTMQSQIDGAIETWTGTEVPTLNNAPASSWTTTADRDKHVGDVYFNTTSGYNYRFTKSGSTYSWLQIKDTDITNALQRIQTAEGQITQFDSDISTLKTDTGELKTKTQSLETSLGDKVDTTTFNELEDTVDGHSQTISQHTTAISQKADTSTVNQVTNRVSKNEQDISGINTTIGQLQTTVEGKADGSTVTTISNKLNTVSDTVDGHTQTISSVQSTLSTKADNSTVATLRSEYNETKTTVSGHETRLTATESVANGVRTDFDNLEIGGRNLLKWTGSPKPETGKSWNATPESYSGWRVWSANHNLVDTTDGIKGVQLNTNPSGIAIPLVAENAAIGGVEYTLSFDYRTNMTSTGFIYLLVRSGGNPRVSAYSLTPSESEWQHFSHQITWPSTANLTTCALLIPYAAVKDTWLEIKDGTMKLEKGNKPTDWTPAPEDMETEVTSLKTDYANYKQATTEALSEIGTTYATKTELGTETSNRQTAIRQVNDSIALKANSSDVYTKTQADSLISTEVTNRNAAITAKADEITSSVSETYATKSEAKQTDSDSGKREIITEDAAELPLLTLTAYGESVQDGTPTPDAPVPIRCVRGRNLFDIKGHYISGKVAREFGENDTMTGPANSDNRMWGYDASEFKLDLGAGRYTVVVEILAAGSATAAAGQIYKAGQASAIGSFGRGDINSVGTHIQRFTLENAASIGIMLKLYGSVARVSVLRSEAVFPYTPYGYIRVISNGKNRLPLPTWNEIAISCEKQAGYYNYPIQLKPNTTYHLKTTWTDVALAKQCGYILVAKEKTNQNWIGVAHANSGSSNANITTGADGILYFNVYATQEQYESMLANAKPQLEEGSEATDYEPYCESVSYIDLKGHVLANLPDGARDELNINAAGVKAIGQRVGVVDLGTLNWSYDDSVAQHARFASQTIASLIVQGTQATEKANILCSALVVNTANQTYLHENDNAISVNRLGTVLVYASAYTDSAAFKAAMSGIMLYYELAEPQTIDLGYIDLPTTFDGGTVHVDAEIQPVIDASWWTKAGYDAGKAYNDGSADLAALTERVTTAESSITQQAGQIASKVSQSDFNTLSGRVSTAESTITQHSTDIEAKVSKDGVIAAINLSTETEGGSAVKISADKVNIEGAAIFTGSGRLSQTSLDSAYDANGAASAAQAAAISAAATDATSKANAAQDAATNAANQATDQKLTSYSTTSQMNEAIENATGPLFYGKANSTGYIHLGHVPYTVSSTSNYSHLHLTGRIGGWLSTTSGSVDITFKSRADNAAYNTVDRKDDTVSTSFVDVLVYTGSDNYTHYWLKVNSYWYAQLYAEYEQFTEDDHTLTSTEPDGTCVWKLSEHTSVAAPKSTAVKRTQRIYFRKSASGAPTTPGSWVTNGNTESSWTKFGAWSTRIPPIAESKAEGATKYLYLYTCEQREMGDGTLAYTTVLLDDSTTVIDGGNIITGSVSANRIDAASGTFDTANIPNLSAAKITSGDISADRIKANVIGAINSLSAGQIDAARINASQLSIGQSQVTGLTNALAGKQPTGDYATKAQAQGYADAKDTAIEDAAKTASNYITADPVDGIRIADANPGRASTYQRQTSTSTEFVVNGSVTANFGADGATLGRDDNLQLKLTAGTMSLENDTDETVFSVAESVSGTIVKNADLATFADSTAVSTETYSVSDTLTASGTPVVTISVGGDSTTLDSSYVTATVTPGTGVSVALTSDGVAYVSGLLDESEESGVLSVDYPATHYDAAALDMDGTIVVNGEGKIVSVINDSWTSANQTDTYFKAFNQSTGKGVYVGVGSGGQNRGVYDIALNRWQMYMNADGNLGINGNNFIVAPEGSLALKGNGATNITQRSNRVSTRIGAAAPSSDVYFDSLAGLDKNGDSVFYTQSVYTTNRDLYRSFVCRRYSANGQTQYTNGFYLHIDNSGNPSVTFTNGGAAAWRAGMGVGTIGTKNSLAASDIPSLPISKITGDVPTAQLTLAGKYETGTGTYTVGASTAKSDCTAKITIPSGYVIKGIVRISTGANWVIPYAWTWSGSTVTVSVRNFTSSAQSNKTLTVGVICMPS